MADIYSAVLTASAILGLLLLFTKRLGTNMYPIALGLILTLVEERLAHYFAVKYHNNLGVYFFFNPFEYACYAWFFYLNIDYKNSKQLIRLSAILFFSFIVGYLYFFIKQEPLPEHIVLDYVIVFKEVLLIFWSIVYIINIFDQINNYKKLNVFVLLIVAAILFYSSFSIIFHLLEIYLLNYSELHKVPITVMLSPQNKAHMYASQQYAAVKPLLDLTNILLYLCIFVALIKSATKSK
jgi:hypothetical protein